MSGRWVFRIVISTETGYLKHVFEAAESVAEEIHDKINYLLKGRPSQARTEYLAYKERKLTRKSWHVKVK
jgi:viroplasmin and RNaseH domain-containing protein